MDVNYIKINQWSIGQCHYLISHVLDSPSGILLHVDLDTYKVDLEI